MTGRVDFYVLGTAAPEQRWDFACRLTAKAFLQDLRVIVWNENAAEAKRFDDLLWTFNDRAFVPHQLSLDGQTIDPQTPVHLVVALEAVAAADLLVNLADRQPPGLERFPRIAEVIDADPERRRLGRERFKTYREQKLELKTHQLSDTADI
jgi:DNA polymerase-3 subunit chi